MDDNSVDELARSEPKSAVPPTSVDASVAVLAVENVIFGTKGENNLLVLLPGAPTAPPTPPPLVDDGGGGDDIMVGVIAQSNNCGVQ